MRFNLAIKESPLPVRIAILAAAWLVLISSLHYRLNIYEGQARIIRMGYMPVVTNLAAPLLDHASRDNGKVRYKALKFSSFAEMAEALRNDHIQAAFIIAPLAIVLRQQGSDIKIVYIGNRHESTLVARKDLNAKSLADLSGKTIAVPMRYSGHNLALRKMLAEEGLSNRVKIVEMNPPDMASAMATGALDAYFVGEPFAAQTIRNGDSSLLFHVEEVWPDFICNLVITKQALIDREPETVQNLVQGAARSGIWAERNLDEAAAIASRYWNQPAELIKYVMGNPPDRIRFDKFTPDSGEIQQMADLMTEYGLTTSNDISGLIDAHFAGEADLSEITGFSSILKAHND
jgi:NitT/TauT family transport system substrate-binding protein